MRESNDRAAGRQPTRRSGCMPWTRRAPPPGARPGTGYAGERHHGEDTVEIAPAALAPAWHAARDILRVTRSRSHRVPCARRPGQTTDPPTAPASGSPAAVVGAPCRGPGQRRCGHDLPHRLADRPAGRSGRRHSRHALPFPHQGGHSAGRPGDVRPAADEAAAGADRSIRLHLDPQADDPRHPGRRRSPRHRPGRRVRGELAALGPAAAGPRHPERPALPRALRPVR